jgi:hypothetical protein
VFTRSSVAFTSLLLSASIAQAGSQLFEASWTVKALGNEIMGGTGESEFYSAFGIPVGIQCNPNHPRCPFDSTPTDGSGDFAPLGGYWAAQAYCAPWLDWQGQGTAARPAKGETATSANGRRIPPLYRNPAFFTSAGEPNTTSCNALSTGATPGGKGLVQAGHPVTGTWTAITTGTGRGSFHFVPAPKNHAAGVRVGQGELRYTYFGLQLISQGSARSGAIGEFEVIYPYIYSYTYATLRNDAGVFGPGQGPGSFSIPYTHGANTVAKVVVKQGAAKFGGTMRMLGQLTGKSCYYRNGGCLLYSLNWGYDAIGAAAYTSGGVVTQGYIAYNRPRYCTALSGEHCYGGTVSGARFPWTTGSVTVTAADFTDIHNTVHYAKGYDNRTPTSGRGTIQLVTPTLTHWYQFDPFVITTAGIGILRIKFVPEPRSWVMLLAGVAFIAALYRQRY